MSFRHYNVTENMTTNAIRALAQDGCGFIWVGSDDGLCRFDGLRVRNFNVDDDLPDQSVASLMDMGDSLMVGTYHGVYVFDYTTEELHPLHAQTSEGTSITALTHAMTKDKDDNLWFSTTGQGVMRYAPRSGRLTQYKLSDDMQVAMVYVDSRNQVWGLTSYDNPGIWRFDKSAGRFRKTGEGLNVEARVMCETTDGKLWVATWNDGLLCKEGADGKIRRYLPEGDPCHPSYVHSMIEYTKGVLLIGCDDGLVVFNTFTGAGKKYVDDESSPHSISGRFVYPILKDYEGGLWVGTFYSGLNYVSPSASRFESYKPSKTRNSVSGNVINRFCEDHNGNIWIASDDGGLSCFTPRTGVFKRYPLGDGTSAANNVHALEIDGDCLWIGTYTNGVTTMNLRTGAMRHYVSSADEHSLDGNSCYAIKRDSKGNIWVATMDGINLYRRPTDDFLRVRQTGTMIIDIEEDKQGRLWFATQGKGLLRYNPSNKEWRQYVHSKDGGALCDDFLNCILSSGEGAIYVATDKGLCKYDEDADTFSHVNIGQSKRVCAIVDYDNVLWFTTNLGLIKYVDGAPTMHFNITDGLTTNNFMPNAALKASDGTIYIGSVNGFNTFIPYQINQNTIVPKVSITGVDVFNEPMEIGGYMPSASAERKIELNSEDKIFSISFASLSYCNPEKNLYAYRLDGFDKEWNYVGTQTHATYTNIAPGSYTFRVKGTNNDGLWSGQEATMQIVIHPPFYWSLPSKIIYLILLIAIIVVIARWYSHKENAVHEEEMRKLKEEQELEIRNSRIKFFTTVAHEIRTPVSLIIGPLQNVMKADTCFSPSVSKNLSIIERNAQRLLELVNQLLDFRKVEQQTFVMRFTVQNITQLMHAVSVRFEPTFAQNGVTFVTDYPADTFTAIVDGEAITKVISNLLTNARKYTKDYVRLACHVLPDDEHFAIEVTDNGVGISDIDKKRVFEAFFQAANNKPGTGIGLSIVKAIVDQHGGTVEVASEVGKGSTFTVTLPIKQQITVTEPSSVDTSAPIAQEEEPEDAGQPLPEPAGKARRRTVLVVDDNDDMLQFLSENISRRFAVITAHDGIEALDKLRNNAVDMIISDWMMPRMDGPEFCRTVRADANTSHIPFVMLTAKTDDASKTEGMNCGADTYIEKPFSMEYLEACCQNMLSLRQMLRKKYSSMPLEPISDIAPSSVDNQLLVRMQEIIEQNFSNSNLSVNFLAEKLCISRSTLFSKIRALADTTPNEMIQIVRLKKAAQLMATKKYRVNEVCYMVGFNNPSYFSKCFYKQFGMRPTEFINS